MPSDRIYTWPAKIVRVIDGDSMVVVIDQGMETRCKQHVRIHGINCPESRGREKRAGRKVGQVAEIWLPAGAWVQFHSHRYEPRSHHGRLIGSLRCGDTDYRARMLDAGLAEHYDGTGKRRAFTDEELDEIEQRADDILAMGRA